ncbi:mutanase Pc12g07500 [Aspergillus awamori]|uniref:Mutanase Pc12g07500 n=1 Tax=Aspergillus awamori TaxID=105351 RepID=A0A401KVD0_ASPAW|nr:mutanase Pc12g07500 [Aspergillus awamori]
MLANSLVVLAAIVASILNPVLGASALDVAEPQVEPKYVFAHFMVGIVENYQLEDWITDMKAAQAIGIDAFALNCASIDKYTPTQLALAYQAAQQVNFKVFISFDFAYWSNGDTGKITAYMQQYANHPAQMQYRGGAVVSTFVGDSFNWSPVKQATSHPIHAVPNLQDPIAVSPWFATHFNSKNWVFICENLPTLRWEQMLSLKPSLVEIISWNGKHIVKFVQMIASRLTSIPDYGESHYIGPYSANHSDDGSSKWAKGMPHDAWRDLYKPYIAAYKSGDSKPTITQEGLVYWYRPTPKGVNCPEDNMPAPNGFQMLSDSIFVATMLSSPATLTVTSGSIGPVKVDVPAGIVTTNVTMGIGAQTFQISRNGQVILSGKGGLDVADRSKYYNFNVFVGSVMGSSAAGNASVRVRRQG